MTTSSARAASGPRARLSRLAVASLVLLAACASQNIGRNVAGSDPKQLAVIAADSDLNFLPGLAVIMKEVDGVTVAAATSRVTVAPGAHQLTVVCQSLQDGSSNTQFLKIETRAGAHYRLVAQVDASTRPCRAVLEEK